jgi:hypothetical protein
LKYLDQLLKKKITKKKLHDHNWLQGLPLRMRFQKSRLYESALTPILLGLIVGFVAAMMGIGGAFFNGSSYDLYCWYACKINTRNFFICYNFYKRNSNYSSFI